MGPLTIRLENAPQQGEGPITSTKEKQANAEGDDENHDGDDAADHDEQ